MRAQQLTFGSADRVEGRAGGGWGVLRRSPDLPPEIEQRLVAGVSVSMPSTVSAFPDSRELFNRPVRFRHRPDPVPGYSLVWRSVEAGRDHTQRPGNVFTHAARLAVGPRSRAIDWYASPAWLSPYGAHEMQSAAPSDDVLPTTPGFSAVASWFHADLGAHSASLPWLVDALMGSLADFRPIALQVPSTADAAGWIGLVSWLYTDAIAEQMSYSTCEDGTPAEQLASLGLDICAVTVADPRLASRVPVLDVSWHAELTPDGKAWRVPAGEFPRTPWSSMAMDLVWLDADLAETVLARRDTLAPTLRPLVSSPYDSAQLALRLSMIAVPGVVVAGREQVIDDILSVLPPAATQVDIVRALRAERGLPMEPAPLPPVAATEPKKDPQAAWQHPPVLNSPAPPVFDYPVDRDGVAQTKAADTPPPSHLGAHDVGSQSDRPPAKIDIPREARAGAPDPAPPTITREVAGGMAWPMGAVVEEPDPGVVAPEPRPMGVALSKPTSGSRVGTAPPDMADYPFPTPMSALRAAGISASAGIALADAMSGTRWVNGLSGRPEVERLAILHLVSQDRSTDLSPQEFDSVAAVLSRESGFDAIAPALLLLGLRIEERDEVGLLPLATSPLWPQAMAEFIGRCEAKELLYLVLHFSPLLAEIEADRPRDASRRQIGRWAASPLIDSLWSMPINDGRSVAQVVAGLLFTNG